MDKCPRLIQIILWLTLSVALLLLGLILIVSLLPSAAQAQQSCGPRDLVSERLAAQYGEVRQAQGLTSANTVVEVYASDETGSWTIIVTTVQGLSCLIASGTAYEALSETLQKPGDKL